MLRGLALFIGLFLVVSAVMTGVGGVNHSVWLFDLRAVPDWELWVLTGGLALFLYALRPRRFWRMGMVAFAGFGGVALLNACVYWRLLWLGELHEAAVVPFSAVLTLGCFAAACWLWFNGKQAIPSWFGHLRMVACAGIVAVGFAWALMVFYGSTDYRRSADAVVVFGAKTYADGRLSDALADRVRTAAELVNEGYAEWLIVSGGPGDGDVHETEAMRDFAVSLGVSESRILLDRHGVNTRATVVNCQEIAHEHTFEMLIYVSHAYHLPRIKLVAQQAGISGVTTPAKESYRLTAMPYYMAREVAAWWVYWARV